MADESDGVDEEFEGHLRIALIVASRAAESLARMREQAARRARAANERQARQYADQLQAQRAAVRAYLTVVDREQWWNSASPQDVAGVWETARAWQRLNPDAARAVDRIREEIRNRYGIDIDTLDADPPAVRDALAQQGITPEQADQRRRQAGQEATEAALLLDEADRAERAQETDVGDQLHGDSEQVYDSAQRREDLAASLKDVTDAEVVQARVESDTFQGRSASEAVIHSPGRAPRARKGRWTPWSRGQQPSRTLGR